MCGPRVLPDITKSTVKACIVNSYPFILDRNLYFTFIHFFAGTFINNNKKLQTILEIESIFTLLSSPTMHWSICFVACLPLTRCIMVCTESTVLKMSVMFWLSLLTELINLAPNKSVEFLPSTNFIQCWHKVIIERQMKSITSTYVKHSTHVYMYHTNILFQINHTNNWPWLA